MQMSTRPKTQTQLDRGKNGAAAYVAQKGRPITMNTTPIMRCSAALMSRSGSTAMYTIPMTIRARYPKAIRMQYATYHLKVGGAATFRKA